MPNQQKISVSGAIVLLLALLNSIVLEQGLVAHPKWYWLLCITVPLFLISLILFRRKAFKKSTIKR